MRTVLGVHLEGRLRIRLGSVSVGSIPGGGRRVLFPALPTAPEDETPNLTVTVGTPAFRAAGSRSPTTRRSRPRRLRVCARTCRR